MKDKLVTFVMGVIFVVVWIMVLCGCSETQKAPVASGIKPLSDHLMPTNEKWAEEYGGTLETRMVYNLALIRHDQKQIFNLIQSYHAVDPNEVNNQTN